MTDFDNRAKKNKAIRALESKCKKNDIKALFQLGEYYRVGRFVEKDEFKSEDYLHKALFAFNKTTLSLNLVKLIDYCGFEDETLTFKGNNSKRSKLTVIVGNNGAGKTSVLVSIVKSLGWLTGAIRSKDGKGFHIQPLEINNKITVGHASILSEFSLSESDRFEMQLSKAKEGASSIAKSNFTEVRLLGEIYQLANSKNKDYNLPLMAYYPVSRAIDVTANDIEQIRAITSHDAWGKMDGYNNALTHSSSFKLFFQWFRHFDDVINSTSKNVEKISKALVKLETELNLLKSLDNDSQESEKITSLINEKKIEYKNLEASLGEDKASAPSKVLEHVINAIRVFMPELSNLRIERVPRVEMYVDKSDIALNVLQLSQGEKSLMALVADISRRLVLLNPSLENPLNGAGIVLIDEVDLHLHPEWQQSILINLTKTFPSIQFVVSTHSPQVLSTVHHDSIRVLNNSEIHRVHVPTLGEESKTILEDVLHVDSRPKNEMSKELKIYMEQLNKGEVDSEDVIKKRKVLEKHFGSGYSQFRLADMVINRWKAVRNKRSDI